MNADGSGQTNLTNNPAYDDEPELVIRRDARSPSKQSEVQAATRRSTA